MRPQVSIIIVHYHAQAELFNCLASIAAFRSAKSTEVIVINNDERKEVKTKFIKQFPWVHYLEMTTNIGFGAANNLAAAVAWGKFLFFLNPDTRLHEDTLNNLLTGMKQEKPEIIAPQELDAQERINHYQALGEVKPLTAVIALSIINRIFPNNPVSRKYWLTDWDRKSSREVDFIQGSSMLIEKKNFQRLGGFDEHLFLYFEDTDFCFRARKKGWRILYYPQAKLTHLRGRSTPNQEAALHEFQKSRGYFLNKHYGVVKGRLTQTLLLTMENAKLLLTSLLIGLLLIYLIIKVIGKI